MTHVLTPEKFLHVSFLYVCSPQLVSIARMRSCDGDPEEEGWYPVALRSCPQHTPSLQHTSSASYLLSASSQRGSMGPSNKMLVEKKVKNKRVKS